MLTTEGLGYAVGGRALVADVSTTFRPGALSVIVGANGAGKSTLIRLLGRQLDATSGGIVLGTRPMREWPATELARVRAVLSQSIDLAFPLRVDEVVMMGRYPHMTGAATERDRAACEAAMARVDVLPWAERDYLTLSGGERQRVQFARVLAQIWEPVPGVPRVLLLDEPLTFLDIRYQFEFMHIVEALLSATDLIVVAVLHDLNLAARFASDVLLMADGRVLAQGGPSAVLTPALVETAFGIRARQMVDEDGRVHLLFG